MSIESEREDTRRSAALALRFFAPAWVLNGILFMVSLFFESWANATGHWSYRGWAGCFATSATMKVVLTIAVIICIVSYSCNQPTPSTGEK